MKSYYFDYNATTPVVSEVWQIMEPFLSSHYANPSSLHHLGKTAARAVREARKSVAALLEAHEENEIVFTSGGTESNNAAFRSALATSSKKKIVTSCVEHSSIFKLCRQLEKEGYDVHYLPVDSQGRLDKNELLTALSSDTALVSLMMANNETGVLFPIEEVGQMVKEKGILFHVDAVQAVGKLPLHLKKSPVDFISLSAHKFYGPKGTGVLYVRKDTPFRPLIFGGAQERSRRAGTENVPGIVGLGAASRLIQADLAEEIRRLTELRDYFERRISEENENVFIYGQNSDRLCNTSNIRFDNVDGEALLFALDQEGICVSSGSACMSGSREPSRVLKAMGFSDQEANSSLRFSFGRSTVKSEIEESVQIINRTVRRLRTLDFDKQHVHPINAKIEKD